MTMETRSERTEATTRADPKRSSAHLDQRAGAGSLGAGLRPHRGPVGPACRESAIIEHLNERVSDRHYLPCASC